MDGAVQTNAASAEESASAAQELDSQASGLMTYVSQLNVIIEGVKGQLEELHETSYSHVQVTPHKTKPGKNITAKGTTGGFLPH